MLEGKVALITGAGRGIGQAAALLLAREGAALVVNDLEQDPAGETAAQILRQGGSALACAGDVTSVGFAERFVGAAVEGFGRLDIIVNCAGYAWDAMLHKMTDEQWAAMLEVHLTAPFRIVRAASSYLRDAAKQETAAGERVMRKIVNISSISGTGGNPGQANYAAAKAGIVGLTKTIAREWGPFNVNCNAVAYGPIGTRMLQTKEKGEKVLEKVPIGVPADIRQRIEQAVPLGRVGSAEEAAGGILFLACPLSDFVTGHVLHVDGGLHM